MTGINLFFFAVLPTFRIFVSFILSFLASLISRLINLFSISYSSLLVKSNIASVIRFFFFSTNNFSFYNLNKFCLYLIHNFIDPSSSCSILCFIIFIFKSSVISSDLNFSYSQSSENLFDFHFFSVQLLF